jgi:hypothetical protein
MGSLGWTFSRTSMGESPTAPNGPVAWSGGASTGAACDSSRAGAASHRSQAHVGAPRAHRSPAPPVDPPQPLQELLDGLVEGVVLVLTGRFGAHDRPPIAAGELDELRVASRPLMGDDDIDP